MMVMVVRCLRDPRVVVQLSTNCTNLLNIQTGHAFGFWVSRFGAGRSGLVLCFNSA